MSLIHKHLLLKIELNGIHSYYDDPVFWETFVNTMITDRLEMQIAIPARAVLVEDPDNYGVTGSANLTTSHISWHVWSRGEEPIIQMDIYSCRCFDAYALRAWILKMLDHALVKRVHHMIVDRNDNTIYDTTIDVTNND